MGYRLAIFDFDGTLANSFPFMLTQINDLADEFKVKRIDPDQLDVLRRMEPLELMKMHDVPLWKVPMMAIAMQRRMANVIRDIPLFDGIAEAVAALDQAGVILGLVSSNAEDNIRCVLGEETARLFRYYECHVTMFGKSKRLRNIVRASGIKPKEAIAIGDEVRDLDAARKIGMHFGAVSWGYTHPEALLARSPEYIFDTVPQMVEIIAPSQPNI